MGNLIACGSSIKPISFSGKHYMGRWTEAGTSEDPLTITLADLKSMGYTKCTYNIRAAGNSAAMYLICDGVVKATAASPGNDQWVTATSTIDISSYTTLIVRFNSSSNWSYNEWSLSFS